MAEKYDNQERGDELPAEYGLFVFDQTDHSLLAEYEEPVRNQELKLSVRGKAFGKFLQRYVDKNNPKRTRLVNRIDEIQRDSSGLGREERYTNSANVMFGVMMELSGPGDDFDEWFKEDQDIAEMRRSIEKDTPELSEIVDPHVLAAIGQRLKVVQFYEDAKHYFFSDLYPESPVVTRLNGEFSEIPIGHSGEAYTPTEDIKKILIFDPELWEGVKTIRPDGSEFQWVVDYCQTVMRSMWEVAPDDKTARLTNDGVNVIYSIIMYANFQEGGDARKLIDSGEDLVIARNMIIDKEERGYDNLAAYKLWAGLYLDLRETLFGVDQNERNIKLNDQLREAVNS